jgi:hypothetical protein
MGKYKYKIKKNRPLPSDDKITGHQNFDQLLKDYNQLTNYKKAVKPLYKDKRFLGLILLIAIVLLTVWISEKDANNTSEPKSQQEKKR